MESEKHSTRLSVTNEPACMVAAAANANELLYMPKGEIARLQALQSAASISAKEGKAPHDSLGSELKTIVLSDDALDKFKAGDPHWETATVPLGIDPASPAALKGVQFSKAMPKSGNKVVDAMPGLVSDFSTAGHWVGLWMRVRF